MKTETIYNVGFRFAGKTEVLGGAKNREAVERWANAITARLGQRPEIWVVTA